VGNAVGLIAVERCEGKNMNQIEQLMALADQYAHVYSFVGDDTMPNARQALRTAIEAALTPGEPEGWKLVPVEPTLEHRRYLEGKAGADWLVGWSDMLAAAPHPQQWVGLTDEQREQWVIDRMKPGSGWGINHILRDYEAMLREKNGGGV
jgi:hypothetical protein